MRKKDASLRESIRTMGRLAVAFSGGVDSTFLARVAHDELGDGSLAVTVDSEAYPPGSIRETRMLADLIGIRLVEIKTSACEIPEFAANGPERCYHCKKALFGLMLDRVAREGFTTLADGSNLDDTGDYRPGMRALDEMGIASPLRDAGFTKGDIRALSRELGLPTWDRQSFACLASRFPYGEHITPELLERTWRAEELLRDLGFARYRVRNHGDVARIELEPAAFERIMTATIREQVVSRLKALGYSYVSLDMQGYRTGSMNEVLGGRALDG